MEQPVSQNGTQAITLECLSPALHEAIKALQDDIHWGNGIADADIVQLALLAYTEGQQAELARCVERAAEHYAFGLRDELAQRLEELQ